MATKNVGSTFQKEMQNEEFREQFEREYADFLLSEWIIAIMKNDKKTVRKLAEEVGLSPTVIQKLRSGKQEDIKLSNFIHILQACGYHLIMEKAGRRIPISIKLRKSLPK